MIGKEILNYRIVSVLGKGGMGSVYIAEHTLINNERVAIKVINANMANDFTKSLLKDEAEHLAGLNHPNIVSFKNYHIDKEGNIYLIMEYAEGKNLEDFIKNVNGLVVEDRICPLFEPILDAVGYAHKKKILHCDIKPANVVITTEGVPKILDFGIAKIIKNQGEEEKDNLIMGTPSYMSPEQVKGEHLDERSDIYSLGVLLHHMLTGNPPYDTTTLTEQQINTKVVEEPLPRMRTFYKYVSDKVQKIVDKATAKNPDDRYKSCEEFKKALHNAIYPPKMPTWAKIAAAAVVVLLIGGGWFTWDYNRVKTFYYKDYTERWGIPEGIGELSSSEHSHMHRSYKFVYQKRKLLSVSHVNSLDKLIDDGESERAERPVEQTFSYTADGNVSRVVVKDRSGKVLYVKSYNEKLNTMAFQYDDEHGTERCVLKSTVGYDRSLESMSSDNRGRISRWWLEYDEEGFLASIKYAGLDNSPVGDENGIYGRTYVRDEKGREVEIHYIGIDGKPQPTKWGLGIKKFYYDDKDNWVKAEYLTTDRKPALDAADGVCIYELEHDEYGNVIYAVHKDSKGKLTMPKMNNIAGIHNFYDEKGLTIKEELLGIDKKPMMVKGLGWAIRIQEYDDNGYVSGYKFQDTQGNPVNCTEGNASSKIVNDEHGNAIEQWFFDTKDKLCCVKSGYAGLKNEVDSLGNVTKSIYYGTDKKPCLNEDLIAGYAITYDDKYRVTSFTNLGLDKKPALNKNEVVTVKYEYDKRGNNTKISFYEADGKTLRLSGEGIAGWNDIYDDAGNHMERNFFDTKNKPMQSDNIKYACVKYTYDNNNNLKSTRYYNIGGSLTSVDGVAGYDYVNDKTGNVLESTPIGLNGSIASGKLKSKYKYDVSGNEIEQSLWNATGPALNTYDVHIYRYKYNSRNEIIEKSFYDKSGKLTINTSLKAAIVKMEYNERGDETKESYFGTDKKPCNNYQGWSSATYTKDVFGNTIKQCFFGTDGKPCDPKVMPPVGIAEYDKWGNMTYLAAQDGYGNFIIMPANGWAISRMTYDKNGNMTSQNYFNTKDKPMLAPEGYHQVNIAYDKQNRVIERTYWGTDGKPTKYEGYHKYTLAYYEGTEKEKENAVFGTKGEKVMSEGGWHKRVYTYNEDYSLITFIKFYDTNGSLIATKKWNGSEFVFVEPDFNWQSRAKALNSELPLDMGDQMCGMVVQSLKITSSNSCELTFKIPHTTSNLSSDEYTAVKNTVTGFVDLVENELKHKPYVTGNLYDKNGTLIFSYKK